MLIEYAGTRYSGWQIQKNARTVPGEIDRAVREATRPARFELYGAGRTDAGVHALAQVAHLELYTDSRPMLRRKINDELPADIHIRAIAKAPHQFHARHDAIERSYLYQISTRRTAFGKPFVWWIREPLSVDAMREAAARVRRDAGLRGVHRRRSRREVDKGARGRDRYRGAGRADPIRVQGSHFLWKMVRRMVGVLAAVGRGEIAPPDAAGLLDRRTPRRHEPRRLRRPPRDCFSRRSSTKVIPPSGRLGR